MRPLSIELRKLRAGVGYRSASVSRSPSPIPPPRKAPVKIIRPRKEPVASTSKIEQTAVNVTSQTSPRQKAKAQKITPPNNLPNPPKQSPQPLLPPPPAISSPPLPPIPLVPSDLYISMMSGLAMANMPETMQAAAVVDPMAAFQLAQMCFAPPSAFPLPHFPLIPPQPDHVAVQPQLRTPKHPPKPVSSSTTKSTPAPPPVSPLALQDNSSKLTLIPNPTSTSDLSFVAMEMDPLALKRKRQARKQNIGWIPEPVFPDRGTFNFVPTDNYVRWSSSDGITQPDPQRSLVMEDLPTNCRSTEFVRSWSDQFSATSVYLNGGGKALIEFPSREVAEQAYDSPRLRDGLYKRAMHVRVFWYRPQVEDVASPMSTAGNTGAITEAKDVLADTTSASITSGLEEPVPVDINDPTPPVETFEAGGTAQPKGEWKGFSLPPPDRYLPDVYLPVRPSTAPTSTSRPGTPFMTIPSVRADQEQRLRSNPVDLVANGLHGWSERTPSLPPVSPSPPVSSISCTKTPSLHLRSLSPGTIERSRTPTGSPPSLRYPSTTPEIVNDPGRMPSPSEEGTPTHDTPSPTSTCEPAVTGDSILEQQLRMRLLAMKQTKMMNKSSGQSSSTSTPSTAVDPEPDTLFKVFSPPPVSKTPDGIVTSESLELLATSFIADTLRAAQGFPSEPERFDTAIKTRLNKKRGSSDAFGSSMDIAIKRQRLAQQIEESKRIMEQYKAAKSKEERNRIYALWEESNRFVSLNRADCALTLVHNRFLPLFLGPWSYFRSPQLRPFSGPAMRKVVLLSTAKMKGKLWICHNRQSWRSSLSPFITVTSLHFYCVSRALLATCFLSHRYSPQ